MHPLLLKYSLQSESSCNGGKNRNDYLEILPQTLLFSFSIFYKFGLILIVIQSVAKKSY